MPGSDSIKFFSVQMVTVTEEVINSCHDLAEKHGGQKCCHHAIIGPESCSVILKLYYSINLSYHLNDSK